MSHKQVLPVFASGVKLIHLFPLQSHLFLQLPCICHETKKISLPVTSAKVVFKTGGFSETESNPDIRTFLCAIIGDTDAENVPANVHLSSLHIQYMSGSDKTKRHKAVGHCQRNQIALSSMSHYLFSSTVKCYCRLWCLLTKN